MEQSKKCSKCGEVKNLTEYTAAKTGRLGVRSDCRLCHNLSVKYGRKPLNEERTKQRAKYQKQYRAENEQHLIDYHAEWSRNNLDKVYAITRKYQERKAAQTPKNLTLKEKIAMQNLYVIARELSLTTGVKYEVDHVKPLSKGGKNRLSNLQVITRAENRKKGSKIIKE